MLSSAKRIAALGAVAVLCAAGSCGAQDAQKLTLAQAVSLAVANSRDLALARTQYETEKSLVRVYGSSFEPSLFTGSGLAYINGFPQAINGQQPSVFQLTYDQALREPELRGQFRAEQERLKNQETELARKRDEVIVRAATSYLELAKVHHAMELLTNERASAQQIIEYTRKRAATGMELPIEVTRGEVTLAKIELRVAQLRTRTQVLTAQLQNLTGLPPERLADVSPETLPDVAQSGGDLIHLAVEKNPFIKEAETERNARQHILNGVRGAYWPSVDLLGQYSVYTKFDNYAQYFNKFQTNNVSFGLLIKIPIFNAKTSADVSLAKNQLSEADLTVGSLRNNAQVAATQEVNNLSEQEASLNVAKLELKLAQESLALTQSRFDRGDAALKDLEQARLDEGEKWLQFLDADFAHQQAQLSLMQMTGQLTQVFK